MSKHITLILLFVLVAFFQNCAPASYLSNSSKSETSSESGGQPYDGKPYVLAGNCPDGTLVDTRVLLTGPNSAVVVRENCQDVQREITSSDFRYDPSSPSRLEFAGRMLTIEGSPAALKPLAKGYLQWSNALRSIATPTVYFLDGMQYSAAEIQNLKSAGHTVVCLITAGVVTPSAPDYARFAPADIGKQIPSTNQYWVDTRSANVRSILLSRLVSVSAKGCNGIAWDQTDAHVNDSGFPLTAATATDFIRQLAFWAHDRGMSAALSATGDLSSSLVNYFEMQLAGGCMRNGTCGRYSAFASAGKPIFDNDWAPYSASQCSAASAAGISLWYSSANSDGSSYTPCP